MSATDFRRIAGMVTDWSCSIQIPDRNIHRALVSAKEVRIALERPGRPWTPARIGRSSFKGACNMDPAFSRRVSTGLESLGCTVQPAIFSASFRPPTLPEADVRPSVVPRVSVKLLLNQANPRFLGGSAARIHVRRSASSTLYANTCPKLVLGTISSRLHCYRKQRRRVQSPARREIQMLATLEINIALWGMIISAAMEAAHFF
jgi:hypothetical protein